MTSTAGKQKIRSSEPLRDRLSAGEWPVMRACWRLGPAPTTGEVVREVQQDLFLDYRYVQTMLRRIAAKGYLDPEKKGPRRIVWRPTASPEEALVQEMRHFVREIVGPQPRHLQLLREVIDEFEAAGAGRFDEDSLPQDLRVRLIDYVDAFLKRQTDRRTIAVVLGLDATALDNTPTLAGAISLLTAAGGDTPSAALRLLAAVEELLDPEETRKVAQLKALRIELEALPSS